MHRTSFENRTRTYRSNRKYMYSYEFVGPKLSVISTISYGELRTNAVTLRTFRTRIIRFVTNLLRKDTVSLRCITDK